MTLRRCGTCGGSKLVRGLGGMLVSCVTCKGVGFVTETVMCDAVSVDGTVVPVKTKRSYNRTTNTEVSKEALA
jgi:DnaJ-class molecular chaperone